MITLAQELARGPKLKPRPSKADVLKLHAKGYSARQISYRTGVQMPVINQWIRDAASSEEGR